MRILRSLRLRSRVNRGLSEELESHIGAYIEDLVGSGVSRSEAERRARAEFGGITAIQDECRDAAGLQWLTGLKRDFWYALRLLRKTPGVSATAIITLALCIGANTAIFSVVDAVLLRPLPYPEPDQLGEIVARKAGDADQMAHSGHVWQVLRDRATAFDVAATGLTRGANLFAHGVAEHVKQQRVSAGFFSVLGVAPLIGREFEAAEDVPGGAAVAVLSGELWQRIFGGNPAIVGSKITLKGEPHTVVGVMPLGFRAMAPVDVWTPLRPSTEGEGANANYMILARLRPDTAWAKAELQARTLGAGAPEAMKRSAPERTLGVVSLQEGLTQNVRAPLIALWGAVGLVLLIGCVNIASLLLARSAARRREIATRIALGGGTGVLVRQLVTESLLLAMAGGAVGTAIGYAGLRILRVTLASDSGIWQTITLDERVLAVTFALSLLTSVLFGILPAWEAARVDIRTALTESDARTVAGVRNHWPRRILVAGEVALGLVLLLGATLLLQTFTNLMGLKPGFDATNVMTAKISLEDARYRDAAAVLGLYDESLRRIRSIPGIESASVSLTLPYERALNIGFLRKDGPEAGPPWNMMNASYVAGDFFRALRIPLLRGRLLDSRDRHDSAPVCVVNESFAKRYLSKQEPVGSHIQTGNVVREIVGVVGDVQQKAGWGGFGPLSPIPQMYYPASQTPAPAFRLYHTWFSPTWVVRTQASYSGLPAAIQQAVQSVDPQLPFAGFQTLNAVRSGAVVQQRFQAAVVGIIGLLAVVLSAIGVYGLVAHTVSERTREFGIRMALGATPSQSIGAAVIPSILLAVAGIGCGIALSRASAGLVEKLLYGVSATDGLTTVAVAMGFLAIAALASITPALRLLRLNPAETLRHE